MWVENKIKNGFQPIKIKIEYMIKLIYSLISGMRGKILADNAKKSFKCLLLILKIIVEKF